MHRKALFLWTLCFLGIPSLSAETFADLGRSKRWLRLLQFQSAENARSRALGDKFFFARDGYRSPESELRATLQAFGDDYRLGNDAVHCRFPARAKFIRANFPLAKGSVASEEDCKDFLEWKKGLDAKSLTLIFAASYQSNASSLFGHTFLRFDSSALNTLLDYSVNYAAIPDENDPGIVFGFKGIFGGYPGQYSIQPYYMMTKTYLHLEARDLWEYELNLTEDQLDWITRSLWEQMYQTYYNYHFFDENCAYQILALLEVALENYDFRRPFIFFVPPGETVREIARYPELVKRITFRASIAKEIESISDRLTAGEREIFDALLSTEGNINSMTPTAVIDAYFLLLQTKIARADDAVRRAALTKQMMEIAVLRSKRVEARNETFESSKGVAPHLTHKPRMLSLFATRRTDDVASTEFGLSFGMGYHGLLAQPQGFNRALALNYFQFEGKFSPQDKQVYLHKVLAAEGYSMPPSSPGQRALSWRFHSAFERIEKDASGSKIPSHWVNEGGVGLSGEQHDMQFSALFGLHTAVFAVPEVALGPELLMRFFASESMTLLAQASVKKSLVHQDSILRHFKLGAGYFFDSRYRIEAEFILPLHEAKLALVQQF